MGSTTALGALGFVIVLTTSLTSEAQPCVAGTAGGFPCSRVDLLAFMPLEQLGGGTVEANDLWGWTDAETGREFVLLGMRNGTAFVEITNPTAPIYLGRLPTQSASSSWRDVKVHKHHAFIVSEAPGQGMQVFDLTALLDVAAPPVELSTVAHYDAESLSNSHNIAINEDSGFGYILGSNTCRGGLHMVNLDKPRKPQFAGCFSADGYTHDAQCVSYVGPDSDYRDSEVCFAFNEDTLTIVDVTNKATPRSISRASYPGVYTHQGWASDDHMFLLLGDEADEGELRPQHAHEGLGSDRPRPSAAHWHARSSLTPPSNHNLYIRGRLVYQANYRAGLRLFNLDLVADGRLNPAGFFDIYPLDNARAFNGAWSVYPFFPSGVVAVSGVEQGLFLLDPAAVSPTP